MFRKNQLNVLDRLVSAHQQASHVRDLPFVKKQLRLEPLALPALRSQVVLDAHVASPKLSIECPAWNSASYAPVGSLVP